MEQNVERFRARAVSELRLLNEELPRSLQLERREIDRLVDDLLRAVRRTPRLRNASLLDKIEWTLSDVLVHLFRRQRKRKKTAGNTVLRTQTAGREREGSQDSVGALRARVDHPRFEIPATPAPIGRRGAKLPGTTFEMPDWQKESYSPDPPIDLEANFTPAAALKIGEMLEVIEPFKSRDANSHSD